MNHFGELIQKIRDTEKLTSHLDDDEWSSRERESLDLVCVSAGHVSYRSPESEYVKLFVSVLDYNVVF